MESTIEKIQNLRIQGVRVSPDLKPCNLPVDTEPDAENIACCSVANSYENTGSSISIIR